MESGGAHPASTKISRQTRSHIIINLQVREKLLFSIFHERQLAINYLNISISKAKILMTNLALSSGMALTLANPTPKMRPGRACNASPRAKRADKS